MVNALGAHRLVRSAVKSVWLAVLGASALVAAAVGVDPLLTLFGGGMLAALAHLRSSTQDPNQGAIGLAVGGAGASAAGALPFSLGLLFLVMLKIGASLFGGGYVLVAFFRADLV